MRSGMRERRGAIAVLMAICLSAVLAILALVLDGGMLTDSRRGVQAAADAAALAAAADIWGNYAANNGADPDGTASASAKSTAAADGYTDGGNSVITVNIPPTSSANFNGKAGYVEVIITYNQKRGFSSIWASADMHVKAQAVAVGAPGDVAILMLNPHETVAAQIGDNVNIANNGQIFINSDGTVYGEFGSSHGTNAIYVESTGHLVTGGINTVGTMFIEAGGSVTYTNGGSLKTGVAATGDPLASIPEPDIAGQTNFGNVTYKPPKGVLSQTFHMSPGIYGDVQIKTGATVIMDPGIYFVNGGSMNLSPGTSLTGAGVMFYDMPNDYFTSDGIPATATLNLSPPTTGIYRGISVFEPRAMNKEIHIKSIGNITMSGALYSVTGEFDLRPLTPATVFNFGAYIADLAEWSPNGIGTINLDPSTSAPTKRPLLIE